MNPRIPGILAQVITAGENTMAKSSGDERRIAALESLRNLLNHAASWPTDQPMRYVNQWTVLFVDMLIAIERAHPDRNDEDGLRARAVAELLLPSIRLDNGRALEVIAGRDLPDAPARGRGAAS